MPPFTAEMFNDMSAKQRDWAIFDALQQLKEHSHSPGECKTLLKLVADEKKGAAIKAKMKEKLFDRRTALLLTAMGMLSSTLTVIISKLVGA